MFPVKQHQDVNLSKALSWLLRHGALKEHINISDEGFINVSNILNHKSFRQYSLSDIQRVVENQDKQRFSLRLNPTSNELEIKANHGHSVNVQNLQLTPLEVTDSTVVVHGTYLKSWDKIKQEGLSRMKRTHIHFASGAPGDPSFDRGIRKDCNVLIFLNAQKLLEDKIPLLVSPSGVILSPGNNLGIIPPSYFKEVKFIRSSVIKNLKNKNLSAE